MQPIPNITKLSDNVIRILGQNSGLMTLQGTNSYLIGKRQKRLLLDTSDPNKKEYLDLLENVLKDEKVIISDLILTHFHQDHIGALKEIKARKLISDDCRVWKFPKTDVMEDFKELDLLQLTDEQTFTTEEGDVFKIIYTPGHTTDHVILHDTQKNVIFSGDCILGEGTAVFEDLYDYMKSLDKILRLKPKKIFPAHGNVIDNAIEKIEYYIAHRQERERQIMSAFDIANRLTLMGIVEIVYKETPKNLWNAAAINVHHHLTKLQKEGKISEIHEDDEVLWEKIHNNKLPLRTTKMLLIIKNRRP
ncbi:hypothetical protein PVAND_010583 [Polypedilum vanderplanki]|uniref:Beta-lactamase-like protein 2 homolog n=1 Tax=Polypedilum vanderplanki TaxID=319348 RepID=A0A9J6CH76_POLVA|nr:hypothetical protein PVAND_010583 [Polypedilum vanderplanki]